MPHSVGDRLDNGCTVTEFRSETLADGVIAEFMVDSGGNQTGTTIYPDGHPIRVRADLLLEAQGFVDRGVHDLAGLSHDELVTEVAALQRAMHGLFRLHLNRYDPETVEGVATGA